MSTTIAPGKFVIVNGIKTHYTDTGNPQKPPLVFIHGAFASTVSWDELLPHLAADYHLIALDMVSHGLVGGRSKWSCAGYRRAGTAPDNAQDTSCRSGSRTDLQALRQAGSGRLGRLSTLRQETIAHAASQNYQASGIFLGGLMFNFLRAGKATFDAMLSLHFDETFFFGSIISCRTALKRLSALSSFKV